MEHSAAHELPPDVEALIKRVHANETKAVVYATGGAVQSISWLLSVPGASRTVLEAAVPYSRGSLAELLGKEPDQYCSAPTALALAEAAYRRAAQLSPLGSRVVGVAATCALASVPPKRGEHRAYVATHGSGGARCASLTLAKGARSRAGEDELASRLLLQMLAEATGCDTSDFPLPLITHPPPTSPTEQQPAATSEAEADALHPSEPAGTAGTRDGAAPAGAAGSGRPAPLPSGPADVLGVEYRPGGDPLGRLLRGEVRCVELCGAEVAVDAPRGGRVYLPGSFNPLHEGHMRLLEAAVKAASAAAGGAALEGAFELSVQNADKGLLAEAEVRRRVAQFTALGLPVLVTRAPLFVDKAALLPGSSFVVGYDTAVRLVQPKYYGNSYMQMVLDFARLRHAGCRFLVAGRLEGSGGGGGGRFLGLADVEVPPELADLFPAALPEEAFRVDISSTQLRLRMQQQQQQRAQQAQMENAQEGQQQGQGQGQEQPVGTQAR